MYHLKFKLPEQVAQERMQERNEGVVHRDFAESTCVDTYTCTIFNVPVLL